MAVVWTETAAPTPQDGGGGASVTFASVSIGTASADRIVVVKAFEDSGEITGVTIAGDAMTKAIQSATGNKQTSIWYRTVPTGTTANVIVSSGYTVLVGITVGILTGATETPTDTAVHPKDITDQPHYCGPITVPTGGIALCIFGSTSGAVTPVWTVGTAGQYNSITGCEVADSYYSVAGDVTFTQTAFAFSENAMAAAAWEPAAGGGGASPGSIVPTITL